MKVPLIGKKIISSNKATVEFFFVITNDFKFKVIPRLLSLESYPSEILQRIPLGLALGGPLALPNAPEYRNFPLDSDRFFLLIQSRADWGESISEKKDLLEIKEINKLVKALEESLQKHSFIKDLLSGKFGFRDVLSGDPSAAPEIKTESQTEPDAESVPTVVEAEQTWTK